MLKAKFWRKNNKILMYKINGHADYANIGQDIVCAAVSSLYITVTDHLLSFSSILAADESILIGSSELEQVLVDVLLDGLEQIAEQYPDHVQVVLDDG